MTPEEPVGVYLQGRDSGLRAGGHLVTRVRVSYDATTPVGVTEVSPCLFVNEARPFWGTTWCSTVAKVQVQPAATKTPVPTSTASATASSAPKPAPTSSAPKPTPASSAPASPAAPVMPASDGTPGAPSAASPVTPASPVVAQAPATAQAPVADTQLASTGADHTTALFGGGLALTGLGAGALWLRRVLRRA